MRSPDSRAGRAPSRGGRRRRARPRPSNSAARGAAGRRRCGHRRSAPAPTPRDRARACSPLARRRAGRPRGRRWSGGRVLPSVVAVGRIQVGRGRPDAVGRGPFAGRAASRHDAARRSRGRSPTARRRRRPGPADGCRSSASWRRRCERDRCGPRCPLARWRPRRRSASTATLVGPLVAPQRDHRGLHAAAAVDARHRPVVGVGHPQRTVSPRQPARAAPDARSGGRRRRGRRCSAG